MLRADLNGAPTVLALIATTMTSVVCGLFSLAVLWSDDMEPACDPGFPGAMRPAAP